MDHRYTLTVTWTGNTGDGTGTYRGYKRTHEVTAEGPPDLPGSADRAFHGKRERWNREQLLLASLAQCHMLSYLHVCVGAGIVVTHYVDRPTGVMKTESDGSGRFTEVVLHPAVTVANPSMVEAAWRRTTVPTSCASSPTASVSVCAMRWPSNPCLRVRPPRIRTTDVVTHGRGMRLLESRKAPLSAACRTR
jgi:organic hydroperoxide reductase OsmC/OhrA